MDFHGFPWIFMMQDQEVWQPIPGYSGLFRADFAGQDPPIESYALRIEGSQMLSGYLQTGRVLASGFGLWLERD